MKKLTLFAVCALILGSLPAQASPAWQGMIDSYEAIRANLVKDSTDGLTDGAREVAELANALAASFSPDNAGVPADQKKEVLEVLPKIEAAARDLASAEDITQAREAFYELSKPMVQYRELLEAESRPVVAYCPMAKKSWLQPDGEIGNPYYGQKMARCGEIVSR